jgi:hypothetical protein
VIPKASVVEEKNSEKKQISKNNKACIFKLIFLLSFYSANKNKSFGRLVSTVLKSLEKHKKIISTPV